MQTADYDVVILGGGLAGMGLALEIIAERPDTSILILEKRSLPHPAAAFKIGESSVELGAYYLRDVLGLSAHLDEDQLPKYGLRFFFNRPGHQRLEDGLEMGLTRSFPSPSHQIDRGRLENHMVERVRAAGIDFRAEHLITAIEPGENAPHRVCFRAGEETRWVSGRWLVDASGRAGLLKRKLGLHDAIDHPINAIWFRVGARLRVDDFSRFDFREGVCETRWLSTIHLMGTGYWVWIIPLPDDATSIGIVADPAFHPMSRFNSIERALSWLDEEQPLLAAQIHAHAEKILDFAALKRFAMSADRFFSPDRWALTGEAGAFLDPLYSPGTDFIAIGNGFIKSMILSDLRGRPFAGQTEVFEDLYRQLLVNTLLIYKNMYPIFGNPVVMPVKVIWDYAVYWSFTALLYIQGRMTDIRSLAELRPRTEALNVLNTRMQAFFAAWHEESGDPARSGFLDQSRLDTLTELNANLHRRPNDDDFGAGMTACMDQLANLAREITTHAASEHPRLAEFVPEGGHEDKKHLTHVWETLLRVRATGPPPHRTVRE